MGQGGVFSIGEGGNIYVCVGHCGDYDDHVGNDDDKNKSAVTNQIPQYVE